MQRYFVKINGKWGDEHWFLRHIIQRLNHWSKEPLYNNNHQTFATLCNTLMSYTHTNHATIHAT